MRGPHKYGPRRNCHLSVAAFAPAPPPWATSTDPGVSDATTLRPIAALPWLLASGSSSPHCRPSAHPSSA